MAKKFFVILVACFVVSSAFVACDKENGNGNGNEDDKKTLEINSEKVAKVLLRTVNEYFEYLFPLSNFSYDEPERFEYDYDLDLGYCINGVFTIQGSRSKGSSGNYPYYYDYRNTDVKIVFDNLFYKCIGLTIFSGYGTYVEDFGQYWTSSGSRSTSLSKKITLNSCPIHWVYKNRSCDATVTIEYEYNSSEYLNTATVKVKDGKEFHFSMEDSDWYLELD